MKFKNALMIFAALLLANTTKAAVSTQDKAELAAPKQLIGNSGFEASKSGWEATGSSVFSIDTSTPLSGKRSATWDASASGEFLRSSLYSLESGMQGRTCLIEMLYSWDSGSAGEIELKAIDDLGNDLAVLALEPTSASNKRKAQLNFDCPDPSARTIRWALESTADAESIKVDDTFVGTDKNTFSVSQTEIYGTITYAAASLCNWAINDPTFTNFPVDSDCANPVVTENANDSAGKIPGISFANLPPGKYEVIAQGTFRGNNSSSGNQVCNFRFHDGNNPAEGMATEGTVTQGSSTTSYLRGFFEYSQAQSNITFRIQGLRTSGNVNCDIDGGFNTDTGFQIVVKKYPLQSAEAITLETSGWFVDANIGGANIDLTTSAISDYANGQISRGDLDMVVNTGSADVEIPCVANPSTGLTCAAGDEVLGGAFSIPSAGRYEVCMDYAHQCAENNTGSNSGCGVTFQLVETDNNDAAPLNILQEGKTKFYSQFYSAVSESTRGFDHVRPIKLCGTFNWTSAGQKTVRLVREQLNLGSGSFENQIFADRNVSLGQRDIRLTVEKKDQQMPTPVFTDLQNSLASKVNSGETNLRAFSARISNTGLVEREYGDWIDSTSSGGTGIRNISFNAGLCSLQAVCTATPFTAFGACATIGSIDNTQVQIRTGTCGGSASDAAFMVSCYCKE